MIAAAEKPKRAPKPAAASPNTPARGVVRADECYSLPVFRHITNMGEWAWSQARKSAKAAGITLDRKVGSASWVRGDDWIAYLETLSGRDGGEA